MLNKTILMGRLTADPEIRRTQQGTAVTSFTLAVERDFKSQSGEKETDFIDCVAWAGTGEFVGKHFTKGKQMALAGRLQTRSWEDRDGHRRKAVEVVAESVYFADSKKPEEGGFEPKPYGDGGSFAKYAKSDFDPLADVDDDDVPFF